MFVPRNVSHSLDDGHEFYKQQLVVETHMLTEITQSAIGIPYVLNGFLRLLIIPLPVSSLQRISYGIFPLLIHRMVNEQKFRVYN